MRKKVSVEDFTVEELRRLLVEKRRASREDRLERFRRTGRVVMVAPDIDGSSLGDLRSGELTETEQAPVETAPRSRRNRIMDRLLLFVEILAVIGLLFVLFNGVNLIRELNQEVVAALEQPTLTPTPLFVAIVLPSGHTPPTSPEGARPNEAEIPEHLRPLVQSLANIPLPTPGPEHATRIQIPALDVDAPIVQGDGWEQLKKGVGQHVGSANPGDQGNIVLSAHNDIFGELFRDLDRLKAGDQVILYTNQRAYTYVVSDSKVVEPTQVDVMESTSLPSVTLISCYPYLVDNQRIVVSARLQSGSN
ncbi:MAG TPA: class D sortase [Anaerolineales bacterium]|nr:class D sortase [Anaerolineales bacterium]